MNKIAISRYRPKQNIKKIQGLHPVLQTVLQHRNIESADEVDNQLCNMLSYESLQGINRAVATIVEAVKEQKKILIVGDFDADGATSTAVAIRLLRQFGAEHVSYLVPNRFDFGYGLTVELVDYAQQLKPDLIITVDNGISSIDGVRHARSKGIKVVVTDHHLAAEYLPEAEAIVNPNQPGCLFPSKSIAGVGVIFYVLMAVRASLRESGWFSDGRSEPNLASVLDLVALGTVADVVPLDRNNRILVDQGLKRIRSGSCAPGISSILKVAGRNQFNCVASDLGFAVGPRLNAAGRLKDMSLGIECLISDDERYCQQIAEQLHTLNTERRSIESGMLEQAMAALDDLTKTIDAKKIPAAIVLYNQQWHQGVIGILASRIKEQFYRPVIAFALSDNGEIKGSARSIKGLNIRDAIDLVDKAHPHLIKKFGGHAMAAGLTINEDQLALFDNAFTAIVAELLSDDDLTNVLNTDGELSADDFTMGLAEQLRYAGPWGQQFPEPLFDNDFEVIEWRIVGEKHLKLKLQPENSELLVEAIAFNTSDQQLGQNTDKIRAVYKLDVNEFRNNKTLQLMIEYLEPA
ncbi:MAG: single-stranded-DNA-specific exonuclease RecJ [Gammaproteobacteria bacterium]|nr:single-stranded-DNA-specific exonuclease RecJ [Gammaproteobacteria bacterium]